MSPSAVTLPNIQPSGIEWTPQPNGTLQRGPYGFERLINIGMAFADSSGDLYTAVLITPPASLTAEQVETRLRNAWIATNFYVPVLACTLDRIPADGEQSPSETKDFTQAFDLAQESYSNVGEKGWLALTYHPVRSAEEGVQRAESTFSTLDFDGNSKFEEQIHEYVDKLAAKPAGSDPIRMVSPSAATSSLKNCAA